MKELIFDKKKMQTYKNFYEQIYSEFDVVTRSDMEDYPNLGYSADLLNEFLWGFKDDNLKFILKNFDVGRIKQQKNIDDYEWNLIIEVLEEFVKKYPNNKLEFIND